MMVRDKNGVLMPTKFGEEIIRARRRAKSVDSGAPLRSAQEKHENVAQMLSGFASGRLAKGGFWNWEDHVEDKRNAEVVRAAEKRDTIVFLDESPSNSDLYRAARQAPASSSVTASTRGGDLTLVSPPNRSEEDWLVDCVMLFREPLDLSLQDEVPKPQQYIDKLKDIVQGHAIFIDDQAAGLDAVREVLEEVTEGDRSGGDDKKSGRRTDFDSEMVQEQQQEEEKQKEQEQEQQDQVEHDNYPKDDTEWALADLSVGKSGVMTNAQLIGNEIKRLNTFRMVKRAKPLNFPDFMLATENHVDHIEAARNRRLKNVEVLMQWQPEKDGGSYVVLLSLREAQTLRRAMQAKTSSMPSIILFTVTGEILAQSASARRMQSHKALLLEQRNTGRQCARFFDANLCAFAR